MKVKEKEIYEAIELIEETVHPLVIHYGMNGRITSPDQIKNRAFVEGGAGYQPYGKIIVIQTHGENKFTRAWTKDEFEERFELIKGE